MRTNFLTRLVARIRGRDLVAEYIVWLSKHGRITEGHVTDWEQSESAVTIHYRYHLANVQYETAYQLNSDQINLRHKYVPGASVTVRYDPHNPGSSVVE